MFLFLLFHNNKGRNQTNFGVSFYRITLSFSAFLSASVSVYNIELYRADLAELTPTITSYLAVSALNNPAQDL